MSKQNKQNLSAQVVVKPASGKRTLAPEEITAENVSEFMPSADDLEKAKNYFKESGFDVSSAFANSFSITGNTKLFEKIFNTKILTDEKNAVRSKREDDSESSELPLRDLPKEVKKAIETVTFSEPPDFGPGNF